MYAFLLLLQETLSYGVTISHISGAADLVICNPLYPALKLLIPRSSTQGMIQGKPFDSSQAIKNFPWVFLHSYPGKCTLSAGRL